MARTPRPKTPKFTHALGRRIAQRVVRCRSVAGLVEELDDLMRGVPPGKHQRAADRLKTWLCRQCNQPPFKIFQDTGNVKVPFVVFSVLPFVTCPGMGECGDWCYSTRSWWSGHAFFRQVQNTLLVRFHHEALRRVFRKIPRHRTVRLYIDGDFDRLETLQMWCDEIQKRRDLKVYSYSKSWQLFLDYAAAGGTFPPNYKLNLSNGSKYDNDPLMLERMLALPCTRGLFVTVPVSGKYAKGMKRFDDRRYHDEVRDKVLQLTGAKPFSCPGKCGSCTKQFHMCGGEEPVVIGIGRH